MATPTPNLGLIKPDMSDEVDQTIPDLATSLGKIDAATGKLSDLTTTDKTSLVAAISESSNGLVALKADVVQRGVNVQSSPYNAIGNGVADDVTELQEAISSGSEEIVIPTGTYMVSSGLTIDAEMTIEGKGNAIIKASAVLSKMFTTTTYKVKFKNITFDGNNLADYGIFQNRELVTIENCKFYNFKNRAVTTITGTGTTRTGKFSCKNSEFDNNISGIVVYGNEIDTECELINNDIKNVEQQPYYVDSFVRVLIDGGTYSGKIGANALAQPNAYKCQNVFILGGKYINLNRGATTGKNSKNIVIDGVMAENCTYAGVSVDARLDDTSVPDANAVIKNCILKSCGLSVRIVGNKTILKDCISIDHTDANAPFYILDSSDVDLAGNRAFGGSGRLYISVNSTPRTLDKTKGGTVSGSTPTVGGSVISANIQNINVSATYISTDSDIVVVDATSGNLSIQLPRPIYAKLMGKTFRIIKKDSTANTVTVTAMDGDAINGSTTTVLTTQYQQVELTYDGTSKWYM